MLATIVEEVARDELPWIWYVIGFGGQAVFGARFYVQWLVSERAGRSVIPLAFWYLSILGGLMLLAYSCYKLDPVFIVGQSTGTFVYVRNLQLLKKQKMLERELAGREKA